MFAVELAADADEAAFRAAARQCLARGLKPQDVTFLPGSTGSLLPAPPGGGAPPVLRISRTFHQHMVEVASHGAPDRFDLLYALVWRIAHGEADVMEKATDPIVLKTLGYARAVRRDIHKMHAFLRFREQTVDRRPLYVAWFEPEHHILRRAAPFFLDRFAAMDWLILTPSGSACWQDRTLRWGPGGERPTDGTDTVLDQQWAAYYRAIFNPSRLHVNAMLREMPKRYWHAMPETRAVPDLLRQATVRESAMIERAADDAPPFAARIAERRLAVTPSDEAPRSSLDVMRRDALACTRCALHRPATQTVFGEGPVDARLMFVGEQPGDQEDLAGRPFVGPAGQKFNAALAEAGIDRALVYVTNAVKHFKYEPRGKKRIHSKPDAGEVQACRFWLEREIAFIRPALVVALGATAAQSLGRRAVSVLKERGRLTTFGSQAGLITIHPSFLLRLQDKAAAAEEFTRFVADLKLARQALQPADAAA